MQSKVSELYNKFVKCGSREALIFADVSYTYEDLLHHSFSIMHDMYDRGLRKGDRIGIILGNSAEYIFSYFACMFGGFTAFPMNPDMPESFTEGLLVDVEPAFVIDDRYEYELKTAHSTPDISDDDIFAVFHTSGTTSKPKGLCFTADRMIGNVEAFNDLTGLDEKTVMLHVMPMSYMAGFLNTVLSPLCAEGKVVISDKFSAASAMFFWEKGLRHSCNTIWMSPSMVALVTRVTRSEEVIKKVSTDMKYVFVGTASLKDVVRKPFEDKFGIDCLESYGMSEILLVSVNTPENNRKGSVGELLGGVSIEPDEDELLINTEYVCESYFKLDDKISMPFKTGDIGHLEDGSLYITGRKKDIIIHGGYNISPSAVEQALEKYSGVEESCVVGVESEFWGEDVIGFVKSDRELDCADVIKFVRKHLPADAVPQSVIQIENMPRNENGKILKNKLKEML
ncbi:MAG: class I adenylate-forming enzyme family protein [Deferribacterales bacterium]